MKNHLLWIVFCSFYKSKNLFINLFKVTTYNTNILNNWASNELVKDHSNSSSFYSSDLTIFSSTIEVILKFHNYPIDDNLKKFVTI